MKDKYNKSLVDRFVEKGLGQYLTYGHDSQAIYKIKDFYFIKERKEKNVWYRRIGNERHE